MTTVRRLPPIGMGSDEDDVGRGAPPERRSHQLAAALARDVVPIDWAEFWSTDVPAVEWLIDPIIPAGRQVAVYSPAKVGKSLVSLEMAARLASGKPLLGQPARAPASVIYLDLEMTEDDVRERLVDLGFGPDDDLSRLAYYQLPSLPPLDTARGGQVIDELLDRHGPVDLMVVDTMARVTSGDENDAGTYAGFYAHSGIRLKRRSVALLRLDHAGKDITRGQRGSSGKADDVDVVFRLGIVEDKVVFTRTHSRIPWVPVEVALLRETEPVLRHVLTDGGWPAGTSETADLLDALEVPLDATLTMATRALKGADKGRRRQLVSAGLKWRKVRSEGPKSVPGNLGTDEKVTTPEPLGTAADSTADSQVTALASVPGTVGNRFRSTSGTGFPSLEGTGSGTGPDGGSLVDDTDGRDEFDDWDGEVAWDEIDDAPPPTAEDFAKWEAAEADES